MIQGGDQSPYRKPCAGSAALCGHGRLFRHGRAGDDSIPKFVNTTLVRNPDDTLDVPPYENFLPTLAESCEDEGSPLGGKLPSNQTFAESGTVDLKVCRKQGFKNVQARRGWMGRFGFTDHDSFPWNDARDICSTAAPSGAACLEYTCGAGVIKCDDGAANLCFNYTDGTGIHFVSECLDGSTALCTVDKSWESFQASPNRTKYLTVTVSASVTTSLPELTAQLGGVPDPNWDWSFDYETTVDSLSGIGILVSYSESLYGGAARRPYIEGLAGAFGVTAPQVRNLAVLLQPSIECVYQNYHYEASAVVTNTSIECTAHVDYISDETFLVNGSCDIAFSIVLSNPLTDTDVLDDAKNLLSQWPLNDDRLYPWRTDPYLQVAPLVSRRERGGAYFTSASGPLLIKDYTNPQNDSMGRSFSLDPDQWTPTFLYRINTDIGSGTYLVGADLTSINDGDVVHQGIGDFALTRTVIGGNLPSGVTYNSGTGILSGTASIPYDAAYGNFFYLVEITVPVVYDGVILGGPEPVGYENYFDSGFVNYRACLDDPEIVLHPVDWYPYGQGQNAGMFNSQNNCQLPLTATQWPERPKMINKPPGAWAMYFDKTIPNRPSHTAGFYDGTAFDSSALWVCKYAEIADIWPTQNFSRPAGDDKFSHDETTVIMVGDDYDAGAGTFTPYAYDGVHIAAVTSFPDTSGIWGGKSVDGFFDITFSGGKVHLGTKRYELPSGWKSPGGDSDVCFGRLRWPSSPSLLGQIGITPDITGTNFTFEAAQVNFGLTPLTHEEVVDFYAGDRTLIASSVTAVRVDDNSFTTASAYPTAVFVQIHGSAKWYVNDNTPKGKFSVLTWEHDFRTQQEYDRLTGITDCASAQVERPSVNQGGGPVNCAYKNFEQLDHCLPFVRCAPKVVCISPNGEQFENGITIPFPEDLALDERYGSKWQAVPKIAMRDLLWQTPHKPFAFTDDLTEIDYDPTVDTLTWNMDDVSCLQNWFEISEGGTTIFHAFYDHYPLVEFESAVPCSYGLSSTECGPALPAGIAPAYLSPVFYNAGNVAYAPDFIGFNDDGSPAGCDTLFSLHQRFCDAPENSTCIGRNYAEFVIGC